ncbi:hypothetical protein ACQ4PT_020784 [Festuca glaucescens]
MGHSSSRHNALAGAAGDGQPPLPSRFSRFRTRLRLRRRDRAAADCSDSGRPAVAADEFAGIARIRIVKADMRFKDKFFACLSLGERTYRTERSDNTHKPEWNSVRKESGDRNKWTSYCTYIRF